MKNSNTILEIMVGDHAFLGVLLLDFKNKLEEDIESATKIFKEFAWGLEKHIFVEEKVVFDIYDAGDQEISKIIHGLIEDHDRMAEMIIEMKIDLETKNTTDILKFDELLKKHLDMEEKILYPE